MSKGQLNFDAQNVVLALSEVKQMFQMHFERANRYVTQRVYEKILAVDFDAFIEAGWYERTASRRGQRNGYRQRSLVTSSGELSVRVPRDRAGRYQPDLFERYRRVEKSLEAGIRQLFLTGVSTRKVGEVLTALCGAGVSASKVSTVTKALDQAVRDFANQPIVDDVLFLFLDALTVSVRCGLKARPIKLLVAYGIRADGSRCLLSFRRANSESTACWTAFLANLQVRGLRGSHLRLVIMDGGAGLWAAAAVIFPLIPHQLCWVHKLRNVATHCPKRYRDECVRQAAAIMYARSETLACRAFRDWRRRWHALIPKAVACLERDFEKLLPLWSFSEPLRKTIRTTNVIERCFREVRRRLKVMGYFQNSASCDRLIYALFASYNNKWQRATTRLTVVATLTREAA
jgi:putative transposase